MNTYDDNTPREVMQEKFENYLKGKGISVSSSCIPDEWKVPHDMRKILLNEIWP